MTSQEVLVAVMKEQLKGVLEILNKIFVKVIANKKEIRVVDKCVENNIMKTYNLNKNYT
tara:strand:- start:171 stop:347 length:177 start_codon:yes stop_codon:yes gene_type:complete